MRKILESCPSCGDNLIVTEMRCPACETTIRSEYESCVFCRLSPEDLHFVEIFIKTRGNVKEMERELDVSYWAIRSRLSEVIQRLGFDREPDLPADTMTTEQRRVILQQVEHGQLSVEEAMQQLNLLNS